MANNNNADFIGRRDTETGRVLKHPLRFIGGSRYMPKNNPARTIVNLGDGYFSLLPINGVASEEYVETLKQAAGVGAPERKVTAKKAQSKPSESPPTGG